MRIFSMIAKYLHEARMSGHMGVIAVLAFILFAYIFLPATFTIWLSLALIIFNASPPLLRLWAACSWKPLRLSKVDPSYSPFVTIILTCANEPAEIVCRTIEAITRLDYQPYNLLVIDNNNTNKDNWQQIEAFCSNKERVSFIHKDKIKGYKAGALNYALNHLDPKSEIICLVDSDYIVDPKFLKETVGYFDDPSVSIVQAPQDYSGISQHTIGLAMDLRSYFAVIMNQAERSNAVTFTGTLGLIRRELFNKQLHWNERCITEDIEAGIYINSLGYRGVFVDHSLGKGIMPLDFASLVTQRGRWTYGNMQTFRKDLLSIIGNKSFDINRKVSFLTQLLAWMHAEPLASWCLLGLAIASYLPTQVTPSLTLSATLLSLFIIFSFLSSIIFFWVGLRSEASPLKRLSGFLSHSGLLYTMCFNWFYCLAGGQLGFKITRKKKEKLKIAPILRPYAQEISVPSILAITTILLGMQGILTKSIVLLLLIIVAIEYTGIAYLTLQFKKQEVV